MKNALRYFALIVLLTSATRSAQAQTNIPNVWNGPEMTFDSTYVRAKPASRDIAKGESWIIAPLLEDNGVPRTWSTNAFFTFNWQATGMGSNWWSSTNVVYPLYHSVTVSTTMPVVTTYVTNLTLFTYPTTNSYTTNVVIGVSTGTVLQVYTNALSDIYTNIIGSSTNVLTNTVSFIGTNTFTATSTATNTFVSTNIVYLAPQTNTTTVSQQLTSYVTTYGTMSVIDTGRVGAVWVDGMDQGFPNYNWYIGYQDQGAVTYRVNGTLAVKNSPGYSGVVTNAMWAYPWSTTNYVNSIWNQMLWLTNDVSNPGYYLLMAPN